MAEFVGERLRIKTDEGTYEGIVHSIDPVKQRLTLSKVLSCAEGKAPKRLHGFHNFFGHELNNLEVLRDEASANDSKLPKNEEKEKQLEEKRENGLSSNVTNNPHRHRQSAPANEKPSSGKQPKPPVSELNSKHRPSQTAAMSAVFRHAVKDAGIQMKKTKKPANVVTRDVSDEGTTMIHRSPLAPERYLMDDYYSDDDMDEVSPKNPPKTVIMQEYGDRFNNAIKYINSQRVIGLSCEGIHVGRYGKVCWLVIGCRQFTYLFDVMSLGASCFDEGLGDILENANILKVIHDCRHISDALYHQYSIKLVNVFDTQVADIIIFQKEKGGQLPRVVNGLVGCLYEYLNLSPEECHFQKIRINNMQKDELIWSKRPLSQQLLDACAKHVMYLRELRLAQMERMLAEFIFGVDIYLSVIRDDKNHKLPDKKNMNKGRQVPKEFQKLYRFQHRKRNRKFDEQVDDGTDEDDILRPTNAWQEGQVFSEAYKDKHGRLREQSVRPGLLDSSGRGPYRDRGPDSALPPGFSDERPQFYTEGESDGSLGDDMAAISSDYSDTTSNYPRLLSKYEKERFEDVPAVGGARQDDTRQRSIDHPTNAFSGENAFQLHFRNREDLGNVRFENKQDSSTFISGQRSSLISDNTSSPNTAENTLNRLNELNLNDEDFPPLSSSQASSSSSTPPKARPSPELHKHDCRFIPSTLRDNTRTLPAVSQGHSPLEGDAMAPFGRGRGRGANLFQLLQNMPRARLPRFEQANEPSGGTRSTYGTGRDVHAFPTDEELFASPEVTHVSDADLVRGGSRVWVRKT